MPPVSVLYLSHDGALDPLGQSQILPYLVRLSGPDVRMTLLTFEKPERLADHAAVRATQARCAAAGIRWSYVRYHRWPPIVSTGWDLARGFVRAWRLARRERVTIVHARSYVASCLALGLQWLTGARFIFDMRELWVDGRVDGGAWKRGGWLHRLGKRYERWCLRRADAVVSLTEAGRDIVRGFAYWRQAPPPIRVIPTCVDVEQFANHRTPQDQPPARWQGRRVLVYLGSVGSWYRTDALVDCARAAAALWPETLLLMLTPHVAAARAICAQRGLTPQQYEVLHVPHEEVPRYLRWAAASVYFITPSFAKRSSCPTKLGESLAAGLPVLTNTGVGDQDALIAGNRVGVMVDELTDAAYRNAWAAMAALWREGEALTQRCQRVARERFAVEQGVSVYRALYQEVCAP